MPACVHRGEIREGVMRASLTHLRSPTAPNLDVTFAFTTMLTRAPCHANRKSRAPAPVLSPHDTSLHTLDSLCRPRRGPVTRTYLASTCASSSGLRSCSVLALHLQTSNLYEKLTLPTIKCWRSLRLSTPELLSHSNCRSTPSLTTSFHHQS